MRKIETIEKYIILLTIVLYPLVISSLFNNLFETPKLLLLFTSVILLTVIKTIKMIFLREDITIKTSKFDIVLVIFAILYLVSGLVNSINMVDMFLYPANASFVILSVLFYLFLNQSKTEDKKLFISALTVSGFIISIVQIIAIFGISKLIPFLPEIVKNEIFTPLGNTLTSIFLVLILIPQLINRLFHKIDISEKILSTLVIIVFLTNIIGSIYLLLPNKETSAKILDFKTGWSLAIDALKVNPLLGAGPSNFSYVFNKYRPIQFNQSENWQLKYIQSSSLGLTILTESGVLGFVALLLFMYKVLAKLNYSNPNYISILLFSVAVLTLPLSFLSLPLFMIVVASYTESKDNTLFKTMSKRSTLLFGVPLILITIYIAFIGYKLFYAEYLFSQSIKKVGQNQGVDAYNLINKAVKISPYSDRYHLFSSVINLALAENLAKKVDITEEDKSNILKLVQQSIREGKATVAVNKYKSTNWESLSSMYQKLVSFASGADNFAVESLTQAINLDPINPLLRIKLGSLYYSQQKYDLAIDAFKLAILAKPSLPNAHYNLAITYKETKQLDKAKEEMNTTLNLLGKESADYEKALSELQSIEELTKPEVAPEPIIEPQIELPQEEVNQPQI